MAKRAALPKTTSGKAQRAMYMARSQGKPALIVTPPRGASGDHGQALACP